MPSSQLNGLPASAFILSLDLALSTPSVCRVSFQWRALFSPPMLTIVEWRPCLLLPAESHDTKNAQQHDNTGTTEPHSDPRGATSSS